jgi:PadR family transcriptional regulator, regulatory protein PadR
MNPGAVYRTLRQMEKEGLCDAQWETSAADGGARRRTYYITAAGEAYLDAWVEAHKGYGLLMDALFRAYSSRRYHSS